LDVLRVLLDRDVLLVLLDREVVVRVVVVLRLLLLLVLVILLVLLLLPVLEELGSTDVVLAMVSVRAQAVCSACKYVNVQDNFLPLNVLPLLTTVVLAPRSVDMLKLRHSGFGTMLDSMHAVLFLLHAQPMRASQSAFTGS